MTSSPPADQGLVDALFRWQRNTMLRLSPDGNLISYVRTMDDGQELRLAGSEAEPPLATRPGGQINNPRWTADGARMLYLATERGRESWTLKGVDLADRRARAVPHPGRLVDYWLSETEPNLLAYACRTGKGLADLYLADLDGPGGEPTPLARNPGFHRWLVDGALRPRGGVRLAADGSTEVVIGSGTVLTIAPDDVSGFEVLRFSRDGERLFVITGSGAPTRRLLALTAGGGVEVVFEHERLDLESVPAAGPVWFDPRTGEPDLCAVTDQRMRHHFLIEQPRSVADRLTATDTRSPLLLDRSADASVWLICDIRSDGPLEYHRFEPASARSELVMVNRPELTDRTLPGLEDYCPTARDGERLPGYAMRPAGEPPYPTVVLVHGGPAGRDIWRFNAEAQYLAALGYLSLHVNYRGSRGFGSAFRLAGNGEWGGLMQQDLYDAVAHGVDIGLVDPERVAYFGASYGGYAALLAGCERPESVRCAVAVSPPCDLVEFATTPPKFWAPLAELLRRQILTRADGVEVDADTLRNRSPMHLLDAGAAPMLIAHGVRDPRVPVEAVDAFAERARKLEVPVRYLRFEDEGHHVKSNRNRAVLFEAVREFLEVHLEDR